MRALLVATLLLFAGPAHADRLGFDPTQVYKVPIGTAPTFGPADAPITIVVWSDHACGFCYRVQTTLATLSEMYPHQLRWVHRTLPLDEDVIVAAEASYAARAQGAFKPMSDRLYALAGRVDREAVELVAHDLGLDMLRFRADLDTHAYRAQIQRDTDDATQLSLSGTPAFFVNGRPIHGNQPLKVFVDVIDEELVRASQTSGGYDALVAAGRASADTAGGTEHPAFELDTHETYRVGTGLANHQLGPDSALVTLVVWSDFQCPFCAHEAPVLAQLHARFGDDLRIIYRHLAMAGHRRAALAAEAGVAAAEQGKFWAFHDKAFDKFGALERSDLEGFAQELGLDMVTFRAALDDRRYHAAIVAEGASALALGVDGTPTMFVNGQPVVGARDYQAMEKVVSAHLDRAHAAVKAGIASTDMYALVMSGAKGVERADPSRVPDVAAISITARASDHARSLEAACRHRDVARAKALSSGLPKSLHAAAVATCAAAGIDL